MLFCKAIHKGMPRAKWPCQNFNLVNALLIHSWASVKPGIQLMDALLNYPCFTFQNEKLLHCPSIPHVGEQQERMGRAMHHQNMKERAVALQWYRKYLWLIKHINVIVTIVFLTLSCLWIKINLRADCIAHRAGTFTLDMPQTHYKYILAKFGKLQSEVSIYNN